MVVGLNHQPAHQRASARPKFRPVRGGRGQRAHRTAHVVGQEVVRQRWAALVWSIWNMGIFNMI